MASINFPINTENQLIVAFSDDSGAITLGTFERSFTTGTNPSETLQILADEFDTNRWDSDDDGTLVVGALLEDGAANGVNGDQNDISANDSGAAYVFVRSGDLWQQQAYIKASNTGEDDSFGMAVSLSADGNTLAVGTTREDSTATGINGNQNDDSIGQAGAVYVFIRSAGLWQQQAYNKASNTGLEDGFGGAVSLSADGNTLAVSAIDEDSAATGINGDQIDNLAPSSGAVYLY